MTLDLTKSLKTTGGESVTIITTTGREPWPVIGFIGENCATSQWTRTGYRYCKQVEQMRPLDLINVPEGEELEK